MADVIQLILTRSKVNNIDQETIDKWSY